MSLRKEHTLWVSKYRPETLEEYASNDETKRLLEKYVESQDIDNLLLYGIQGTGKTSLAKLITNLIECDELYINASDERSIDIIREKVVKFAETRTMHNLKIIILDEAEMITPVGQAALKSVMETYDMYVRFILTTNDPSRLLAPIKSRCKSISFEGLPKPQIGRLLRDILVKENVKYELDDIGRLVHTHYPDLRLMIRDAQSFTKNGVLTVPKTIKKASDVYDPVIEALVYGKGDNKAFTKIRQFIADNNIKTFERLYSYIYEKLDEFPESKRPSVIIAVAEAQYQASFVIDKEITFMACVANILN